VIVNDLTGTDSETANPRGPQPDLFSNRFAGLAAGLGRLTVSGHLATPQFGLRQRLIAVVTDAPLTASPLMPSGQPETCAACSRPCVSRCPSQAITAQTAPLECEGRRYAFNRIDGKRCDWVKRYALMGESGFKYLGSKTDIAAPAQPTVAELEAALKQHDPIKKYRPVVAEPCVIHCPLAVSAGIDSGRKGFVQ
jgi:ferredoxin